MSNKFLAFFQLRLSRSAKKKANVVASKVKVEKEESDEDGLMASQLENLANFHNKVCIFNRVNFNSKSHSLDLIFTKIFESKALS